MVMNGFGNNFYNRYNGNAFRNTETETQPETISEVKSISDPMAEGESEMSMAPETESEMVADMSSEMEPEAESAMEMADNTMPRRNPNTTPTTMPRRNPNTAPTTMPRSNPRTMPGSMPRTNPSNMPGTTPRTNPSTTPGTVPATPAPAFSDTDFGPFPFVVDINTATLQNDTFRTAIWTGPNLQVTVMSIQPGEDIGLEVHPHTDQFLRIESGRGVVTMGDTMDNLYLRQPVFENSAIFVPAGTWHNVINTGTEPLKLYTVYAPPNHPYGTVHQTKEIAEQMGD